MNKFIVRNRLLIKKINPFYNKVNRKFSEKINNELDLSINGKLPSKIETPLEKELKARIMISGPITLANYMKECLVHPLYGFYNKKNAIGREGHFVTSPELTSVFGELIGIWCFLQWEKLGKPSEVCLCEIGPGKGKLMKDLLNAIKVFPDFYKSLSIHMIESSEHMIKKQQYSLNCVYKYYIL